LSQQFVDSDQVTNPYSERDRADYINEANKNISDGIGGFGSYMVIKDWLKMALDIRDDPKTRVLYEEYSEKYNNSYNSVKNRVSSKEKQSDSNQTVICKGYIDKYEYNSSGDLQIGISSLKCGKCGESLSYGGGIKWIVFNGDKDDCDEKFINVCKNGIGFVGCGAKNILKPCLLKGYRKHDHF